MAVVARRRRRRTCATRATSGCSSATRRASLPTLPRRLEAAGVPVDSAELQMLPTTTVEVDRRSPTPARCSACSSCSRTTTTCRTSTPNFDIPDAILELVERLSSRARRREGAVPPVPRGTGARVVSNACLSSASTPACRAAATAASPRSTAASVAVVAGVITTEPTHPLPERLAELRSELARAHAELPPDVVVVERVLFQTNARTAMSVGQASGIALAQRRRGGLPVVEYSANEVKLAVAGYGAATKEQVQRMVAAPARACPRVPRPPDVADALALALCHLASPRRSRGSPPGHAGARRDRLARGAARRVGQLRRPGGRGRRRRRRRRLPGRRSAPRDAAALGPVGSPVALSVHTHVREGAHHPLRLLRPRPSGSTFELLLGAHGVGPGARPRDPRRPQPRRARPGRRRRRRRRARARARHRQEDRPAARHRARPRLEASTRCPARLAAGRAAGGRGPRSREALGALGYGSDEVRAALERLPRGGHGRGAAPRGAPRAGAPPMSPRREVDRPPTGTQRARPTPPTVRVDRGGRPRRRRRSRPGCGPGAWRISSARRALREHLAIVLEAARRRDQPVDHLLFAGPPGLGKTTLAGIVATEMGAGFRVTSGPGARHAAGTSPPSSPASQPATCCSSTRSTA